METKQDRTAIVALIAGAIALLLGLCLGALGGGVAGYLIGKQAAARATQEDVSPRLLPELPATPESPTLPDLPVLPRDLLSGGALVREVIADSPAARAGVQAGDLITGVNEVPVDANHPLADVLATFKPGDRVELQIRRFGETFALSVTLGEHPNNKGQPYLGVRYSNLMMQPRRQGPQD